MGMTLTTRSAGSLISVILNRKGALSRAVRESRDYDSAVRVRILTEASSGLQRQQGRLRRLRLRGSEGPIRNEWSPQRGATTIEDEEIDRSQLAYLLL